MDKDGKELPDTTEVKANTAYKWIFTPGAEFAANYTTATGELTLYSVSTGGGGGSSSGSTVKTDTVTNPDGSVTKTETKSDGTKWRPPPARMAAPPKRRRRRTAAPSPRPRPLTAPLLR